MGSEVTSLLQKEIWGFGEYKKFFEVAKEILCPECGIFLWKESDGYSEESSFGYGEPDDSFFYEFLAGDSLAKKRIFESAEPVVFLGTEFSLFGGETRKALGFALGGAEEKRGIYFLEFRSVPEDSVSLVQFVLRTVSKEVEKPRTQITTNPETRNVNPNSEFHSQSSTGRVWEYLVGAGLISVPKDKGKYRIVGKKGSGKKSLAKFFHQSLGNQELVVIPRIPEPISKLKTFWQNWVAVAENGTIVLEGLETWKASHQKWFLDKWEETDWKVTILILQNQVPILETYKPFWDQFAERTFAIPSLLEIPKPVYGELLQLVFQETISHQNRISSPILETVFERLQIAEPVQTISEIQALVWEEFQKLGVSSALKPFEGTEKEDLNLEKNIKALERRKILLAKELFSNNQVRMAEALGISRGSLQYKLKQQGLE